MDPATESAARMKETGPEAWPPEERISLDERIREQVHAGARNRP